MRFNKLDLNLLVALDALLSEESISRAAERLHMSQSAMSSALARLRDHFEDQLLAQVGRRMELTPRAEVLKDAVRDVLVRIDATVNTHPEFIAATADREFRIIVSDYTLATYAPSLTALAREQSGTVRFRFVPQVEEPHRVLERGDADMLIFPRDYCADDHPVEDLWMEEFVCVVCARGAHAGRPLTFERYVDAGHVVMQPPDAARSFEAWFMQRFGVERRIDVTTFSFASVAALVAGTDRVATVHRRLALLAAKSNAIELLPPPMPMPPMTQAMQWHKYRTQDPGLVWLRRLMHHAVQRMDNP